MPRIQLPEEQKNICAFLDMTAISELGEAIIEESGDDGYNVLVGSKPGALLLFDDYSKHPNRRIQVRPGLVSTAAGRYQILYRFWPHYKEALSLPDFGPESQDKYAIQQFKEQKAYKDILEGYIEQAINKCSNIWASFPGAGYGQHEHKVTTLLAAYSAAGGEIA